MERSAKRRKREAASLSVVGVSPKRSLWIAEAPRVLSKNTSGEALGQEWYL